MARNSLLLSGALLLPNNLPAPLSGGVKDFRVLSWNGRGLCVTDRADRMEAGRLVSGFSRDFDVLCFQEVHGRPAEILRQFQLWLPNWQFCVSGFVDSYGFADPGTGGDIICLRPGLARGAVSQTILVPGRCHVASFALSCGHSINVVNAHNFDFLRMRCTKLAFF